MAAAVAVAAGLLTGLSWGASSPPAQALSGADFDPGNIITDQVFFNSGAMSESQVQSFLASRIGSCSNSNCLNVKRLDTASRPADAMCNAYQGASQEPVSRIIAKVAQACGINPQVLLVTLQKEQSLVSGSIARAPSDARLERAMGYACPDSANGGCDPSFAGVYNQLYKASWQFKRYANPAGTSNYFTQYAPGGNRTVLYNPNAACGSKSVFIKNQATANLYYYTPYTPNAPALANLNGTGDSCSAYGNRNFWVYFTDWFGSTTGGNGPQGALDSLTTGLESVSVNGWAFDRDLPAPIGVHVYVDKTGYPLTADRSRPDVGAAYPSKGNNHGFQGTVPASPGVHEVCVYAIGLRGNGNTTLGCRTVTIASASPVGAVDSVVAAPGGVRVNGWALDPESTASIAVHAYVDGVGYPLRASGQRPDIGRAYPANGAAHGFTADLPASAGARSVCFFAINQGAGGNSNLGCKTVTAVGSTPVGALDVVSTSANAITVAGWALDGDTTASIPVHVYVDGVGRVTTASNARPDIARNYPAYGAAHGFSSTVTASAGSHSVCVYAINQGAGTSNTTLGCRTVVVGGALPVGNFESALGTTGGVRVNGWVVDPDTAAPLPVAFTVDGAAAATVVADQSRPDVARSYPTSGPLHGFGVVVPAAPGSRTVCGTAKDSSGVGQLNLGCRTVTVP